MPSLKRLSDREVLPLVGLQATNPLGLLISTAYLSTFPVEDCGLEEGVPSGVGFECLGDGASALAFREPERGVMLGLTIFLEDVVELLFMTPLPSGEKDLSSPRGL